MEEEGDRSSPICFPPLLNPNSQITSLLCVFLRFYVQPACVCIYDMRACVHSDLYA